MDPLSFPSGTTSPGVTLLVSSSPVTGELNTSSTSHIPRFTRHADRSSGEVLPLSLSRAVQNGGPRRSCVLYWLAGDAAENTQGGQPRGSKPHGRHRSQWAQHRASQRGASGALVAMRSGGPPVRMQPRLPSPGCATSTHPAQSSDAAGEGAARAVAVAPPAGDPFACRRAPSQPQSALMARTTNHAQRRHMVSFACP